MGAERPVCTRHAGRRSLRRRHAEEVRPLRGAPERPGRILRTMVPRGHMCMHVRVCSRLHTYVLYTYVCGVDARAGSCSEFDLGGGPN